MSRSWLQDFPRIIGTVLQNLFFFLSNEIFFHISLDLSKNISNWEDNLVWTKFSKRKEGGTIVFFGNNLSSTDCYNTKIFYKKILEKIDNFWLQLYLKTKIFICQTFEDFRIAKNFWAWNSRPRLFGSGFNQSCMAVMMPLSHGKFFFLNWLLTKHVLSKRSYNFFNYFHFFADLNNVKFVWCFAEQRVSSTSIIRYFEKSLNFILPRHLKLTIIAKTFQTLVSSIVYSLN